MGIRKYSKTFKNIQKHSKNDVKTFENVQKYSKTNTKYSKIFNESAQAPRGLYSAAGYLNQHGFFEKRGVPVVENGRLVYYLNYNIFNNLLEKYY